MKKLIYFILISLLTACASNKDINLKKIKVGMTREVLYKQLGKNRRYLNGGSSLTTTNHSVIDINVYDFHGLYLNVLGGPYPNPDYIESSPMAQKRILILRNDTITHILWDKPAALNIKRIPYQMALEMATDTFEIRTLKEKIANMH